MALEYDIGSMGPRRAAQMTNAELANYMRNVDDDPPSALDSQVGGGHYKNCAIQPVEYIHKNGLGFIEGCIVKYITRYQDKGGKADLDKVIHFANILKELEYGES